MELPSRRILHKESCKDGLDLKLFVHPQGQYVGCMNKFLVKKTAHYSVELFDTVNTNMGSIAHRQVMIDREVHEFHSVVFEPRLGTSTCKVAIHTTSKKKLEAGQKQFSNDPNIQCVDIYQLKNDKNLG